MKHPILYFVFALTVLATDCLGQVNLYLQYINQRTGLDSAGTFQVSSGVDFTLQVLTETPPTGGNGSDFYRLSTVGISTVSAADVIGKVALNKISATPVSTAITFGIPSSLGFPLQTGSAWKGLVKSGNVNFSVNLALGVASSAMDITGPVVADTVSNFDTEGAITSAGSLSAFTASAGCVLRAAAGIQRRSCGLSVEVSSAPGNFTIRSETGNIDGHIQVGSTSSAALTGFWVDSGVGIGGDIIVTGGEIRTITATGNIVSPAEFSSGQTWDATNKPALNVAAPTRLSIRARDGITKIRAARIAAHINSDSNATGSGYLRNLAVTGSPYSSSGATHYGSVTANLFFNNLYLVSDPSTAAIYVAGVQKAIVNYTGTGTVQTPIILGRSAADITVGPVTAPLSITGNQDSGATFRMKSLGTSTTAQSLSVGGNLAGSVKVEDALFGPITVTGTIPGQIIINANAATSSAWSSSTSSLSVNGSSVSGIPYYPSTALGGGAVGLVPFRVHGEACFPPAGATVPTPSPTDPLRFTFYGPIQYGTGYPVTVWRRVTGSSTGYTDITSQFSYSISGRSVYIRKSTSTWLESGYQYQIVPGSDLRCAGLITTSNIPVSAQTEYTFFVQGGSVEGCDTDCE